jgi:RNA polymerase sigma-70 factor (ECF subfamily)
VVQETFLRAWKGLSRFDGTASLASWLSRIATNASIDVVRRRQAHPQTEFDVAPMAIDAASRTTPAQPPHPSDRLDQTQIRERFDLALGTLSAEHRAVIVLKEIEDLSYQEIADTVGCSIGTVMSRLFYARKKLQTELRDLYEEL